MYEIFINIFTWACDIFIHKFLQRKQNSVAEIEAEKFSQADTNKRDIIERL